MFDQTLKIFQTFFGRAMGKVLAGIALCFGLGVMAAYMLPQYLVTVEVLHAEVLKLSSQARKGDSWQELQTLELRKTMQENRLWDLEEKTDASPSAPSERQKGRLQKLRETVKSLDEKMRNIRESLKKSESPGF